MVQDALLKALAALPKAAPVGNPEAWLFRIAHNSALDFLRRRARTMDSTSYEELEGVAAADDDPETEGAPLPALPEAERSRLARYVDRFNARDFDAIREMLADDVRVELVNKAQLRGGEATNYFTNYAGVSDWHFVAGEVDGHPAALVCTPGEANHPAYFIVFEWRAERIELIRDFRYARYASQGL